MTPLRLISCCIASCALLTGCAQKAAVTVQPTRLTLPPLSAALKPVKTDFLGRFESRLTEIEKMLGEPMK
ncbi:hypothetical protein ABP27_22555 [Salmonella enterica subsp. enterica serovar Agona]|nr:hypothetical protein [Salmonella enterica subsp. enterica serovar Agona]